MKLRVPTSTYRLQFSRSFRFTDARRIIPYLHDLGAGDLYASPIFAAMPGSTHGYDVIDPTRLNPEIGTVRQLDALSAELSHRDMGLLLDIVPNHMNATPGNPWWRDVLMHGPASPYARVFDIDWDANRGRLLLPVLGDRIERCVERGDISLDLGADGFCLSYFDLHLPLDPATYTSILRGAAGSRVEKFVQRSNSIPSRDTTDREERLRLSRRLINQVKREYKTSAAVRRAIEQSIRRVNSAPGLLSDILDRQAYDLRFWRTGADRLNYRRFFDITTLAGIRVEEPDVMELTHSLVKRLVAAGVVTGLRIDHIDGLGDPARYLHRLQRLNERQYVVVEKILVGEETLDRRWPVAGTTGYDFLRAVNDLFVEPAGLESLNRTYRRVTGNRSTFEEALYRQKKKIIRRLFGSEVSRLTGRLALIASEVDSKRRPSRGDLRRAIIEVTAVFPVYRTYIAGPRASAHDREIIHRATVAARQRGAPARAARLLERVLSLDYPRPATRTTRKAWLEFAMRFQQFTGPALAKGQEDTAFYTFNPLRSLNEVGEEPEISGDALAEFHAHNKRIQRDWPATMTTTSTHDTKRSEDARARINVLSELPDEWEQRLARWREWNAGKRTEVNGSPSPDANEEVILYQALLGVWPLDAAELAGLPERMKQFMIKAAREAKTNTSWRQPDPAHEKALERFVEAVLRDSSRNPFRPDLTGFLTTVQYWGHINSLAQTLLKIASPGVPDIYQGCESWDFSLVDPDNRRPVDFAARRLMLSQLKRDEARDRSGLIDSLNENWRDGRIKLYTTWKALQCRRENADIFIRGRYDPVYGTGRRRRNVVAFTRRFGGRWLLAVAPRLMVGVLPAGLPPVGAAAWGNATLRLPPGAPLNWTNVFTSEPVTARDGRGRRLRLADLLGGLPVGLFLN